MAPLLSMPLPQATNDGAFPRRSQADRTSSDAVRPPSIAMASILPDKGTTMELAHAHTQDSVTHLHGFDGDALSLPAVSENVDGAEAARMTAAERLHRGHVLLDNALLRQLRQARCMSQQDLADDCWRRNIPLSLTTIKRAELGRAVRFRIAREFARCFDVLVTQIVRAEDPAAESHH
jgi:hypothetical protein